MKTRICPFLLFLVLSVFPEVARAEYGRFAIISDTHVGAANSMYTSLMRELESEGITTVIHTGDAVNRPGSQAQWNEFSRETGPERLYLTPGNHDIKDPQSYRTYLERFHSPYYSFSDGDTLFVMINTEIPGQRRRVVGEQLAWLRTELDKSFRYKFVFLHEPLYPFLPFNGLDRYREERNALHTLFVEKGVSLVVAGHDHIYSRMVRDGVEYVVQGALGGRLPWFAKGSDAFRYIRATRQNGGYAFEVTDMAGVVRDHFSVVPESVAEASQRERQSPALFARFYRFLAHLVPAPERLGIPERQG